MSLWNNNKPPYLYPDAVATPSGWVDPHTGELLVTVTGLSTYKGGASEVAKVFITGTKKVFAAGDYIVVEVAFTEKVAVTGTPTITATIHSNSRTFSYFVDSNDKDVHGNVANGTGTNRILFRYQVASAETATTNQIVFTSPISGTITDSDSAAGSGATGTAVLATSGSVKSVTVGGSGTGYTNSDPIIFTGGGGSGAAGTIQVTSGNITGVTVSNGGSGYTSAPTLTLTTSGGSGNTLTAVIGKAVASVTVTAKGSAYGIAPTIAFSGGGGSGATATSKMDRGQVGSVTITAGGTGYTSVPTVAFNHVSAAPGLTYTTTNVATGFKIDGVAPTVTAATITGETSGTHFITNDFITFTLTTSKVVYVTGVPYITVTINGVARHAVYTSGTKTTSLVFKYEVVSDDVATATNVTVTSPIVLNGGTIKDAPGNAMTLTFTGPTMTAIAVN
jgi:hypothetical protein